MRTKCVKRYYCDYCKQARFVASAMTKHEKRCTNNPHRVCGMCKFVEQEQPNLATLIALLPSPKDFNLSATLWGEIPNDVYELPNPAYAGLTTALDEAMPRLIEASNEDLEVGCPACILAALRQSGIMKHVQSNFDFKKARERFWSIVSDADNIGVRC